MLSDRVSAEIGRAVLPSVNQGKNPVKSRSRGAAALLQQFTLQRTKPCPLMRAQDNEANEILMRPPAASPYILPGLGRQIAFPD